MTAQKFAKKMEQVKSLPVSLDWVDIAKSMGVHHQSVKNYRDGIIPKKKQDFIINQMNKAVDKQLRAISSDIRKLIS